MKILKVILGILLICGGVVCLATPVITDLTFAYFTTILCGVIGLIAIIDYFILRKSRENSEVEAIAGGAGVVLSIFMIVLFLFFPEAAVVADKLISAILLLGFVLVEGILTVVSVFTYRKFDGAMRILTFILGILMVIAAIVGFWNIGAIALAETFVLGIIISVAIMVSGINMIMTAFSTENKA